MDISCIILEFADSYAILGVGGTNEMSPKPVKLKNTQASPAGNRRKEAGIAAAAVGLAELLEALPDMCFLVGADGELILSNARARSLIAGKDGGRGNRQFAELLPASSRETFRALLTRSLSGEPTQPLEADLSAADGTTVNVELHLSRYVNGAPDGMVAGLVVARDISDRKKQELDLLRFTNLAQQTVNPIEITDDAGNIIYVNPAFEKASGYTQAEVIGKNPNVFGSGKHPKSFWMKMWQTISAGKVWVGEVENKRRNGSPFYTQLLISPIVDGDGKVIGYFGIHRDISEQKQLEQQLIHAQKMESIGLLAAGLAHEVGNPLASISSVVQVIQRTTDDEFTQEKLELIKSQISRISRIIRDLVDFSRRSSFEVQLTDVNKSLQDALEIVRVGKKAKDVAFVVSLDNSLPPLPLVPDQIEQVFINLLINALDALYDQPREGPGARPRTITVESKLSGTYLAVTVQDTGKGISDDELPKIFEPFYTTKKVGEGTGLGLWVSYGIIKSFRGEIKVKSTKGVGTTFTIRLPLHSDYP